ncbi:carboxypeptidase M32 [Clostridium paraputrificum]|uniref:carboxypeptidase M32 n=1 Tax=Clostridium TaxID=1485 RepID=UPI003D34F89F
MNKEIVDRIKEVKEYISKVEELEKLLAIAYWDMKVCMPSKATEERANTLGFISGEIFSLITSDKVKSFIEYFDPLTKELNTVDKAMIRTLKKKYGEIKNIPEERYKEYSIATSLSEAAWEEAREKNDFEIFEPHLKKIVEFQREFAEYYGYEENKYDALLAQYEEGITVKKLDKIFGELKEGILNILDYIKASGKKIDKSFLYNKFDIESQKEVSLFLLNKIKFDMNSGRLDETTHPFTTNFGNKDVRITTHYYEEDILSNIYSVIHEGGHGLYEQHISDDLIGTGLAMGASMGIHESQSRFYENMIGRSKEFLGVILKYLKEKFEGLEDINLEEFYEAVNYVEPSLIRIEADELTYSLHIIIRYEIEKALINGEIEVSDLPKVWNEKYVEYLGVEPKSYKEGILQDMHWSAGDFGYFPSYALGNIYGGQFLNKILEENKNAISNLVNGDTSYIGEWLKKNIHQYGAMYRPAELIKKVTGEEITTKYFLDYLEEKYKKIY